MRKLYFAVISALILSVLLFISSFVYLDKSKHRTYYYIINLDGRDVGAIKVDKFATDDKLIYKSVTSTPFEPVFTETKSRLDLDKKYNLASYTKETYAARLTNIICLENKKNLVAFVSRYNSKFACVDNIPIRKETFVFEDSSPVTYLPIIENYNFARGRSQGFNALTCFSAPELPPMKRFITLTSIKDEYIKINSRKIKTENLILKIRNYPQGSIWVAKSDHALIKLELPASGIRITRTFKPGTIEAKENVLKSEAYLSKDVSFSGRLAELAGTVTVPAWGGRFPAVLLVGGEGSHDRKNQGLFVSLADYLSKNGFCVLRFDRRGFGLSEGDALSTTDSDEIGDLNAALQYLASQKETDPQKIIVIGHSKGAFYALRLAADNSLVNGVILMAPSVYLGKEFETKKEVLKKIALSGKWNDDYLNLAIRTLQETESKVKNSKNKWAYILGKKCFVGDIKEEMAQDAAGIVKNIKIPTLIMQGKEDEDVWVENAVLLDKAIGDAGNPNHTLRYYGYLGHFLGKMVNDGTHRMYYDTNGEVLDDIRDWIGRNIVDVPQTPGRTPEAS